MSITLEGLPEAVRDRVKLYTDDVSEKIKAAVDKVSIETNSAIKQHISFKRRTGRYVRSFALKTTRESPRTKYVTWYVKAPHYRRTHLLEYGHRTRNGRKTRAFPHIKYGEEIARRRLPELIEEAVGGG